MNSVLDKLGLQSFMIKHIQPAELGRLSKKKKYLPSKLIFMVSFTVNTMFVVVKRTLCQKMYQ